MKRLIWGAGVVLAFGCGDDKDDPSTGVGSVQPNASPVDKLFTALGGEENIEGLTSLRVTGAGTRYIPHEGARPEDAPIEANTFERSVSIDFGADALRVDTDRDIQFLFPGNAVYSDIVRGNMGASTQPFFGMPLGALSSDRVASIRRQELLLTPHFLLRELSSSDLSMQADVQLDGETHHRLVTSEGPAPLTLFINAETGALSKIETMEHDFYRRDVPLEITFGDWQAAGGISFPRERTVVRDGLTLFTEEVSEVEVNPTFEATSFELPMGVTPTYDAELFERGELSHQWYYLLGSIGLPFSGVDTSVTAAEVQPGVVQLLGGSHHSFVVEQEGGVVLVDAPLYEDRGRALFQYIESEFAGKPITHVVASHFHEDHVAGIREVLGSTEATLVVQASVEDFWREVLAAPSTLRPDALAMSPRDVTILTVPDDGQLALEDGTRPVNLYHLNTEHAADMLLTHETSTNTVFVVDIYSPGNAGQLGAADLDVALANYQVPTETLNIVGGHGMGVDDYATLQSQVQ